MEEYSKLQKPLCKDVEAGRWMILTNPRTWSSHMRITSGLKPRPRHIYRSLASLARWSLSPFRGYSETDPLSRSKPKGTAYLDGLRGFAAFLVYWHHHELWAHDNSRLFENGFAYQGERHLVAFPIIRNFFTGGHFAVSVFFVISGYVLATKPLRLIHNGEFASLNDTIGSALFRRWFRLFTPLIVVTFLYMSTWHLLPKLYILPNSNGKPFWTAGAKPAATYSEEIWFWYVESKNFSFVFNQGALPWLSYHFHSWSVPLEFKGSIVVYTTIIALSRTTPTKRLLGYFTLLVYFLYIADGWYCALFIAGTLFADIDHLVTRQRTPAFLTSLRPFKTFVSYHVLAVSLFLGGVPSHARDVYHLRKQRWWFYLSFLKPQAVFDPKWFFLFFASTGLVACIPHIRWLRRFFETPFCQYLGRISFALYLVHGPVLWLLGDRIYTAVGFHGLQQVSNLAGWVDRFLLPRWGILGLEFAFLVPHLVLLPFTLWLSGLVTRFVDDPSVRLAHSLYAYMLT